MAASVRYAETRRRKVLGLVRSRATQGLPMLTAKDISKILGIPGPTVVWMLRRLASDGEFVSELRGGFRGQRRRVTMKTGEQTDWSVGSQEWKE